MDFTIRSMKESDLDDVGRIFYQSFADVGENWSLETSLKHVKQNFFGDTHFVAVAENKIVGFLMSIILTREEGDELFIDSIAILPEYRKNNIGKSLWDKAEESAKQKKLVNIRLLTNPHLSSYDWYKKMGFRESGWVEVSKSVK